MKQIGRCRKELIEDGDYARITMKPPLLVKACKAY